MENTEQNWGNCIGCGNCDRELNSNVIQSQIVENWANPQNMTFMALVVCDSLKIGFPHSITWNFMSLGPLFSDVGCEYVVKQKTLYFVYLKLLHKDL